MVLKDAILVTGKEDARCEERQAEGRIKRNESEGRRIWSIKICCANIIDQHIKFHPSDDFTDIFNTTHPNSAIDSL